MTCRAPTRAPLLTAIALSLVVSARASAKATWQALGTVASGWTDNVLDAPNTPLPNQRGRESDFFFQLAPGAALTTAAPRFISRLGYTLTADVFVEHSEGDSYTNTLDWAGFADLSPTTDLLLVAQSQEGRLSTFNLSLASAAQQPGVLPTNTQTNFFGQLFSETLSWNVTPEWRTYETGFFRAFIPIDRGQLADSYEALGELGAEHAWRSDALGLVARTSYVNFLALTDAMGNVTSPGQEQLINTAFGRWQRDWSLSWSSELDLGVVEAEPLHVDGATRLWQPSVLAALRYFKDLASAEVRYTHDILPNPIAGSSFLNDEVGLSALLPLPKVTRTFIGASASYQHSQLLNEDGSLSGSFAHVINADVTVDVRVLPELGLFARYAVFDQLATNEGPSSDPLHQITNLPSILRNTVMVGMNVIYPAVAVARVPTRRGTRVDRSDQPGIPEYHAPTPR